MVRREWARSLFSRQRGFTIVELLIVIVVIAILAAITVVAYTGIQDSARTSALAQGIKQVEKALRLKATADGISTWWHEGAIPGTSSSPRIADIVANTNLKDYLQSEPVVSGVPTLEWDYDNDNDTYNGCSSFASGVNILMRNVNDMANVTSIIQALDTELDDGNVNCGKLRYYNSSILVWNISPSGSEL